MPVLSSSRAKAANLKSCGCSKRRSRNSGEAAISQGESNQGLRHADVVGDLPVNNRQDGTNLFYLNIRNCEIVPVQNRQIREFADLDGADLLFHPEKPAVAAREHSQSFISSQLLVAIDLVPERVHACRREIDMRPRIQRGDVNAIAVHTDRDPMIDNRLEGRADDDLWVVGRHPPEARHLNTASQILEAI